MPGLRRAAAVGLVTPLRDGMNLVAKEYVVAQDPDNPACWCCHALPGAAEQLKEALLVNPYDPAMGMADSIQQALQMPLAERQARHQKLCHGAHPGARRTGGARHSWMRCRTLRTEALEPVTGRSGLSCNPLTPTFGNQG